MLSLVDECIPSYLHSYLRRMPVGYRTGLGHVVRSRVYMAAALDVACFQCREPHCFRFMT